LAPFCGILFSFQAKASEGQDELQYKFKPGDSFRYENEYRTRVTVEGSALQFEFKYDADWTVTAVDANGKAKLTQKIGRVRLSGSVPQAEFRVESKEAGQTPEVSDERGKPFLPFICAFTGCEITMTVDRHGGVSDLTIPKKVLDGLKDLSIAPGTGETFATEGFRHFLRRPIQPLPTGASAKGNTWNHTTEFRMNTGQMRIEAKYADEGAEKRDGKQLERISVKPTLTIGKGRIAPRVIIKSQKGKGYFLFDRNAGRLVEYSLTHDLEQEVPYGMATEIQPVHSTWKIAQLERAK
jgi:hypothetical protein